MSPNSLVAAALGLALVAPACRRSPPRPNPSAVASTSVAPDRLAPGEAPPSVEKAFELVLPRGTIVRKRFATTIHVAVPLSPEEAATFVRRQASQAEAVVGASGTIFSKLRVLGADVNHYLRIEITSEGSMRTALVIDRIDDSPRNPEPYPEAMKKIGLTPDGKLIDPKRVE